ncbi:MAG TPA: UDP-N-acetylmuramoyl-tripeptide--D-alanyl-D-alanine ligase [Casimicrobiaceae bacterium]|nr:UDP-N-acetylmuramoyl-tripeptide--D-alanyl-D-alanine ligase [Casimicrobiaceae bacterium]
MMDTATAARAIAGTLLGENVRFDRVTTDSRALRPGDLFVALTGERFDGHEFVSEAFARGAAAAVVAADRVGALADRAAGSLVAVTDPVAALAALASFWRRRYALPVAAIVGSNGKTTVKEMTAAILRAQFGVDAVLATPGNLNNHIGLPLTVLGLRGEHRAAALEIGMNHRGETAALAAIAQPTIAIITNAQREHQEFMRSVADVADEHASVLGALPHAGAAVINADDPLVAVWREAIARRNTDGAAIERREFALDAAAPFRARLRAEAWGSAVELETPVGATHFDLHAAGRHNAANALAAIAGAMAAGAGLDAVRNALSSFRPVPGRLEAKSTRSGATVIDDTYNANPDSVRAAIAVLSRAPGERWLVLGDMGEVGDQGPAFHREVGEHARAAGVDRLFATGELAAETAAAFGRNAEHLASVDELVLALRARLAGAGAGVTLLVKGSRFMRMERVVAALTGEAPAGAH